MGIFKKKPKPKLQLKKDEIILVDEGTVQWGNKMILTNQRFLIAQDGHKIVEVINVNDIFEAYIKPEGMTTVPTMIIKLISGEKKEFIFGTSGIAMLFGGSGGSLEGLRLRLTDMSTL